MSEPVCSKCGRKIVWAKTPAGKANPFVKVTIYEIVDGQAYKITEPPSGASYISHFVDCPSAKDF